MHILFAGGGTAGHINPALAVASYIKSKHPTAKISYIGKKGGMEERLVAEAGYEFYPIEVAGFQRKINLENIKRNIKAVELVFSSSKRSRELLKNLNPDLVVGTGGYVSGPVLREAAKLKIKTAIHEQNAFPGVTTKLLVNSVDLVMLAMKDAKSRLKLNKEPIITGNPVRSEMLLLSKEAARAKLGIENNKKIVLSMGGSLGAEKINNAMKEIIKKHWTDIDVMFIHGTGRSEYNDFVKDLEENKVVIDNKNLIVKDYLDNTVCLPAADLVVSRAGAISLTEIGVCSKPCVFVPSPNVSENHQYFNALSLKKVGASELVEEAEIDSLEEKILNLVKNDDELKAMSAKVRAATIANATEKIYVALMELLEK